MLLAFLYLYFNQGITVIFRKNKETSGDNRKTKSMRLEYFYYKIVRLIERISIENLK